MKYNRTWAVIITGMGTVLATTVGMVGCSGDDTSGDAGPDVATDVGPDTNPPDGTVQDTGADQMQQDAGSPVLAFAKQIAMSYCTRFQGCCNGIDAGPFDFNTCTQYLQNSGWNGSLTGLVPLNQQLSAELVARGNISVDQTSAAGCLAALATLSCPVVAANEYNSITDKCYGATVGTLGVGASCIATVECKNTEYCNFNGVADAGKTDAGTTLGQCATLVAQNGKCGLQPYGDPNFTSSECAYKGWHTPAEFCDYDTFPDAAGYSCQPLRANNDSCFFDQECASGLCGTIGQDCLGTTCQCLTSRDQTQVCTGFKLQDAGPG